MKSTLSESSSAISVQLANAQGKTHKSAWVKKAKIANHRAAWNLVDKGLALFGSYENAQGNLSNSAAFCITTKGQRVVAGKDDHYQLASLNQMTVA